MTRSGKDMVKLLKKHGWVVVRVTGSHHIMVKEGYPALSVPVHANRDLKKGLERKLLKQAGLKSL